MQASPRTCAQSLKRWYSRSHTRIIDVDEGTCAYASISPSSQTKGTNTTSFLTHVRKERSGVSTPGLRRCHIPGYVSMGIIRGICAYAIRIEISCTCTYVIMCYFYFLGRVLLEDFRAIARSFGQSRKLMIL